MLHERLDKQRQARDLAFVTAQSLGSGRLGDERSFVVAWHATGHIIECEKLVVVVLATVVDHIVGGAPPVNLCYFDPGARFSRNFLVREKVVSQPVDE